MSILVQYLKFLKSSPGENEKKEKKAELPGYAPSVAGSIDNEKKDEDKLTSSITDHGLASQKTPKNINASSAEPVAMRSSSSAAAPAFTQPVANPGRGYNTSVPRPQTQQQPTKIPRVLERIPMANSVNDPRSGTLLDKQGSLGYSRNTGISDVEGEIYVNGSDVELLGKLGFEYSCEEYLGLEKTSEVLDVYSYIEKVAGVPKEVAKLIDAGQAFSGEYLKDMGYSVPKGYEVKGDLVCPIEKKASKERVRVVLPYENQYLLEKLMNPKWPDNYGKRRFPGGGIDGSETPAQAASREFMEELGINTSPDKFEYMGLDPTSGNHYLKLMEHGLAPGKYKASVGSDPYIYLEQGLPEGLDYLGADISKFAPVEKTEQSFQQTGKEEKESSEKTAAANPAQTILITGHSGSGKTTLSRQLAEKLGIPVRRVDAHRGWDNYIRGDDKRWKETLTPGTKEHSYFTNLVNRATRDTLKNAPESGVIEGTQLGHLTPEELAKFKAHIVVGGTRDQSIAQRIQRSVDKASKQGITFSPEEMAAKKIKAEYVANYWEPGVEKFRKLPGVLNYNHSEHQIDPLVEQLKHLMGKQASAASRRIMEMLGTADQGKVNETLTRVTNLGKSNEQPRAIDVPSSEGGQYTPAPIQQNSRFSDLLRSKQRGLVDRYGGYNTANNSSVNSRLADRYRDMQHTSNRSPEEGPRSGKVEDLSDGDSFSRQRIDAALKGKSVYGVLPPKGHSQGVLAQFKVNNPNFTEEPYFTPHATDTNLDVRKTKNSLPALKDRVSQEHLDPTKRDTFETVLNSQNVRPDSKRLNASQYFIPSAKNKPGSLHTSQLPNALQGYMYKGNPVDTIQAAKNLGEVAKMPTDRGFFFSGEPAVSARYLDSTALTTGSVGNPMNKQHPDYVAPAGFRELRKYVTNARTSKNSIDDYQQNKVTYSPAAQPPPQVAQPPPPPQAAQADQGMPADYMRRPRSRVAPPAAPAPSQSMAGNLSRGLGVAQNTAAGANIARNINEGNYGEAAAGTGMMAGGKLLAKNPLTAKALPALGAYSSGVDAINRAKNNDLTGAAISGANTVANGMLLNPITAPVGALASAGLTGVGMARDAYRNQMVPNPSYKQTSRGAVNDSQPLYPSNIPSMLPRKDIGKPQNTQVAPKLGEIKYNEIIKAAAPTQHYEGEAVKPFGGLSGGMSGGVGLQGQNTAGDNQPALRPTPPQLRPMPAQEAPRPVNPAPGSPVGVTNTSPTMSPGTGNVISTHAPLGVNNVPLGQAKAPSWSEIYSKMKTRPSDFAPDGILKGVGMAADRIIPGAGLPLKMIDKIRRGQAIAQIGAGEISARGKNDDDPTGAMIDRIGAIGGAAAIYPHPYVKGIGLAVQGGAIGINLVRDYAQARAQFPDTLTEQPVVPSSNYPGTNFSIRPEQQMQVPNNLTEQPVVPPTNYPASNFSIRPEQQTQSNVNIDIQSLDKSSEFTRFVEYFNKSAAADHPLVSSNIKAVGHDKKEKVLDVAFHSGSEYAYKNVPRSLYDRLLKAKSPGKFLNKHIKKDKPFEYEKVAGMPEHIRKAIATGDKALLQAAQSKSVASRIANIAAKKRKLEVAKLLGNEEPKLLQRGEEFQKHFPFSVSHEFEQAKKIVDPLYRPDLSKYLGKPKV